jgi:hypothetical protein
LNGGSEPNRTVKLVMPNMTKDELEAVFGRFGIDFSRPGFYDSPEFRANEENDPDFIATYAQYVDSLNFTDNYLKHARQRALAAAEFMFAEIGRDGKKGACIDASGVLQRILDREGIWNYLVAGKRHPRQLFLANRSPRQSSKNRARLGSGAAV